MKFFNNIHRYLVLSLVAISSGVSAIENPVVDDIVGDAVNIQGELAYSVPLELPKTLHDIQPNVVLSYNQSRGLSNAGVSFTLGLTQKIGRCSAQKLSHGVVGGVEVGKNSVYCLDGSVLVKHPDGSYRKYIDDNTKVIISRGTYANPEEWQVYDQQGFRYIYGFEAGYSEISRSWLLTSKQDVFSNAVTYEYGDKQELERILYPGYVVSIEYNEVADNTPIYGGGNLIKQVGPIGSLSVSTDDELFLYEYVFGYEKTNGYKSVVVDRLNTLKRCYQAGGLSCSEPMQFKYQEYIEPRNGPAYVEDRTVVITDTELETNKLPGNDGLFLGVTPVDLDGDGVDEFCFYGKGDQLLCRSGAADSSDLSTYASGFGYSEDEAESYKRLNFIDLNNDNKADLCLVIADEARCALYDKSSQRFGAVEIWKAGVSADRFYQFIDVTKDGVVDLCAVQSGNTNLKCYENNGSRFDSVVVDFSGGLSDTRSYQYQDGMKMVGRTSVPNIKTSDYRVFSPIIIDITADGILDICFENNNRVQCHIGYYQNGVNQFSDTIFNSDSPIYSSIFRTDEKSSANAKKEINNDVSLGFRFIDVNGDALLDYCFYSEKTYHCAFNNEDSFIEPVPVLHFNEEQIDGSADALLSGIHIADINGDGQQDICSQYNTGQYCAYNKGSSFHSLERRMGFVVDSDIHEEKKKVHLNWLRKVFGNSTRYYFFTSVSVYSTPLFTNDLNGDEKGEFCTRTVNGIECHSNHHAQPTALLTEVITPLQSKVKFDYASASSKNIYTATQVDSITPKTLLVDAIRVDSGVDDLSGDPIYNQVEYKYFDLQYDNKTGKAVFSKIERHDSAANRTMRSQFYTEGALAGQEYIISNYSNGILVSKKVNNVTVTDAFEGVSKRINTLSKESTDYDPILEEELRKTTTEFKDIDTLGYPKTTIVTTYQDTDINTITSTSIFKHSIDNWILAKPTKTVVRHNLSAQPEITKTVGFKYYENGSLQYQIVEADSDMKLKTEYQYYDNGTVKNITVTGKVDDSKTQSRKTQYEYDSVGRLLSEKNALDLISSQTYHPRCGAVEHQYDVAKRLIATHQYDDICRIKRTDMHDGSWSETAVEWLPAENQNRYPSTGSTRSKAIYRVIKTSSNGAETVTYFDRTGRDIRSSSLISKKGYDTTKAIVYKSYNRHGQIEAVSRPVRSESEAEMLPEWILNTYDELGRASTITDTSVDKNIRVTTSNYNRFTVTTSFDDFEKSVTSNIFGKTESITEDDKTVSHTYYSDGLLATTSHMGEKTIEISYDERGYKQSMIDSASGTWAYKHNAFGELYWQKDAENNVIKIEYDILGRKEKEHLPESTLAWHYYNSGNGIGQLEKEVGIGNERLYTYDSKGRLDIVALKIDGREIVTKHKYDQIGRSNQVVLNANGEMPTPLYKSYNEGGRLQAYSLPASALKSFDFNGLENDFTKTLSRIKQLEKLITDALKRVDVHEGRALEFSAKADMYEKSLGSANQLVKDLRKKALEHSKEASANYQVWQDYVKKSQNYTGVHAVRRFIYEGMKGNTHNFGYQGSCKRHSYKLGIFKSCKEYHYHGIQLEKFEYNQLSSSTKNTKECRETWSDLRISAGKSGTRLNPKYSQGKYLRSETKRVKTGSAKSGYRYNNVTTKIYEWCKTKEYLPKDLYLEIANNYKLLYDKKKKYTAYANKSETELATIITKDNRGQWYINGIPKTDYQGEIPKATVIDVVDNGGRFSEAVDDYKASNLSQLMAHYKKQFDHYTRLAANESQGFDDDNNDLAALRQDKATEKEAYEILHKQVQQLGSFERLKSLAQSQSELMDSDSKLVVWSALNWHTDGRLKDEIYGNGLRTIREFDHSTGGLDSITTQNADDHVLSDLQYEFNDRGYVESIEDTVSGFTDTYYYDADMLDSWSRTGHGKNYSYDYDYDSLGNLTHKQFGTELNQFDEFDKPYQVTHHNGKSVSYDKKGFVTSAKGSTYDWNSFGKAKSINANGKVTTFGYDAGKNRVKRVDSSGTTYYVSPGYEQVVKNNGDVIHRIHIRNGYESVATLERYEYATNSDMSRPVDFASYYHRDTLGTGVLITGAKAEVLSRKGYTPYGESLPDYMLVPSSGNTDGNAMTASSGASMPGISKAQAATHQIMSNGMSASRFKAIVEKAEQGTDVSWSDEELKLLARALTVNSVVDGLRGYTGHEMLEDSGLVHMNARIYDPAMGRFMTPDSVIPDANKPQAYNRYSYVYNNPATYTDPSGHNPLAIAAIYFVMSYAYSDSQFHQTLSSVLLAAATMGAVEPTTVAGAAATAGATTLVTSAAISGHISGTELRSAALSAVAAGVSFKIGNVSVSDNDWAYKVMYHGAAQGTIGWVRNKDFWGSALAGAAGHASGVAMQHAGLDGTGFGDVAARTAVSATFGGLASTATGGDFAQGAMIAAIVHLYNQELHEGRRHRRKMQSRVSVETRVDGDYHEYKISGLICKASAAGCNSAYADKVYDHVNANDIPFTDNDLTTGLHILGPARDPITHTQDSLTRTSVNIAEKGHTFYPGTVTHQVHFRGGGLYYDLTGGGTGSMPGFNNFVGEFLFRPGVSSTVNEFGF